MTLYQSVRIYVNICTKLRSMEGGAGLSAQLPKETQDEGMNKKGRRFQRTEKDKKVFHPITSVAILFLEPRHKMESEWSTPRPGL
jgi:hypothetical protein